MTVNKKILASVKERPYFQGNDFVLYKNDCLKILEQLPENSVDMIFADPPYFLSNGGFTCNGGKMVSVDKGKWDATNGLKKDFEFHLAWLKACHRVLKPEGTVWVSGTYHSIYQCGFALQVNKFHILNDIAWFKPNASPNLSCRFFTASHETIIWARKDKKGKHTFNYDEMRYWNNNYKKTVKLDNDILQVEILHEKGKQMRSVWAIGTPKPEEKIFGKHPTQKPVELLKRIISSSTKKGEVVLDPFTGSSTTGIVAAMSGRKFIGIDLEKKYLDLSIKRFKQLKKNI
jgi:site-specific DNA-methyltransferase (adenine-specific)